MTTTTATATATEAKLTSRWTTIRTTCYAHPVAYGVAENPAAHGGVCHTQGRLNKYGERVFRRVNVNGSHIETGQAHLGCTR